MQKIDTYDRRVLQFVSASVGNASLACLAAPGIGSQGLVMCELGDASGPFTVTLHFVAIAPTTPDRTIDVAEVSFDVDGTGPEPRETIGPVSDDLEIVEVLALAPLGDGDTSGASSAAVALLLAGVTVAVGAFTLLRRAQRGKRRDDLAA